MDANRIKYNTVLGKDEQGAIYVLDDTFEYPNGTHGATGSIIVPVRQEQIDHALTEREKVDYYEEIWQEGAGSMNGTTSSLKKWVRQISDEEYLESRYESYTEHDPSLIAAWLGEDEPARYELIGCGRIFSVDTPDKLTLIDSEEVRDAVAAIREAEEGNS